MKNFKNQAIATLTLGAFNLKNKLNTKRKGQFAADNGVVIAITVAVAGLVLMLTFSLLKNTIAPSLTKAIQDFFNFK